MGPLEQQRQIEALRVLDAVLSALCNEEQMSFVGLNFHVYHPDNCPLGGGLGIEDEMAGLGLNGTGTTTSHVADDGCLHVVADRSTLREALRAMDLDRARVLTKVGLGVGWWSQWDGAMDLDRARVLGTQSGRLGDGVGWWSQWGWGSGFGQSQSTEEGRAESGGLSRVRRGWGWGIGGIGDWGVGGLGIGGWGASGGVGQRRG